jgi:hypothetical protein
LHDDEDEEVEEVDEDDDGFDSGYGVDPDKLEEEIEDSDEAEMSEAEVEALIADLLDEG